MWIFSFKYPPFTFIRNNMFRTECRNTNTFLIQFELCTDLNKCRCQLKRHFLYLRKSQFVIKLTRLWTYVTRQTRLPTVVLATSSCQHPVSVYQPANKTDQLSFITITSVNEVRLVVTLSYLTVSVAAGGHDGAGDVT